jgi:hypothetical protein
MVNEIDEILLNAIGFIEHKNQVIPVVGVSPPTTRDTTKLMQSETTSAFCDFLIVRHSHLHWRAHFAMPNTRFGNCSA